MAIANRSVADYFPPAPYFPYLFYPISFRIDVEFDLRTNGEQHIVDIASDCRVMDPLQQSSEDRVSDVFTRCAAINSYQILDTPSEPDFDDITKLAAAVCKASFAAISFVCEERQWFKAEFGLGINQTPVSQSFCAHAIRQSHIFEITDAQKSPVFADNPLVTGRPWVRFYAGMPIIATDGTPVAALCVLDPIARPEGLSDVQQMTMRVLAKQVGAQLELRRSIIERDARALEQQATATALRWIATHDSLTHLGNRTLFQNHLEMAVKEAQENGSRPAVILIDVDYFKQINDSLGHDAGDAVLCSFASRLREMVRAGDTVARLGGDEFGIILTSVRTKAHLEDIVRSLSVRLRERLNHNGRLIECRASIGVAIYSDDAVTVESLIKCSDLALGVAKSTRGCAVTFHKDMETDFKREVKMTALARLAIEQDRIFPYYQPKINLQSGEITGFEALLRWKQTSGGIGLPQMIGSAFLDTELALVIGTRMMARVLDDMRNWVDAGVDFGQIAINTCAGDFAANDFAERLIAELRRRQLPPNLIEVEVTEGVFLDRGSHHVLRALTKLSAHGVRIALDDFGTGFASLTHLKQFPVNVIKIDQTFIAGLGQSADDAAIVRALIGLGHSLGMETVAEGIETRAQAAFVTKCGCTLGQGFLFGEAAPPTDIPSLVKRRAYAGNIVPIGTAKANPSLSAKSE